MSEQERLRKEIESKPHWLEFEQELAALLGVPFRLDDFFYDTLKGINIAQMLMLFREGDAIEAKAIVEIGSRAGCSSVILAALAKKWQGYLVCVDPNPHSLWWENVKKYNAATSCEMIKAESPWVGWDRAVDIVFVDGNHSVIPCLVDWYFWSHFLRVGGLMIFHDTISRPSVAKALEIIEAEGGLELVADCAVGTGAKAYRKL